MNSYLYAMSALWSHRAKPLKFCIKGVQPRQFLKTILFSLYYSVTSALEVFLKWYALYKSTFYLLTYLCGRRNNGAAKTDILRWWDRTECEYQLNNSVTSCIILLVCGTAVTVCNFICTDA